MTLEFRVRKGTMHFLTDRVIKRVSQDSYIYQIDYNMLCWKNIPSSRIRVAEGILHNMGCTHINRK